MIKIVIVLFVAFGCYHSVFSQLVEPDGKKHKNHAVYFAWGYNLDWYSKSTIHFVSGSESEFPYDFKWVKAEAHDNPRLDDIFDDNISIPQYSYRLGYVFNSEKGWGIEYNFDHAKYIVTDFQDFHVKGYIDGEYHDEVTTYSDSYMHFEHTNGANFAMINVFREMNLYNSKNNKFDIDFIGKAGCGIVVPRTDATLFGKRLDNKFHVAGYITGIETGFNLVFIKSIFVMPTFKMAYANFLNSLSVDNGRASHSFIAYEAVFVFGYRYNF